MYNVVLINRNDAADIVAPERIRLAQNANRMSARIYRQKHDPQSRP